MGGPPTKRFGSVLVIAVLLAGLPTRSPVDYKTGGPFVDRADQQGKERVHQALLSELRGPSAIAPRGLRTSPRRQGLGKRLKYARSVWDAVPAKGQEYAYAAPRVGPDLAVWAVPQDGEALLRRVGLSLPRNSQNRSRTGLKGLTPFGAKQIRWSCQLLEDDRRHLAMWTVTLTDQDYVELSRSGNWPKFQRRVIDLLVRHLKAHGDPAAVIAVVEVGRSRLERTGRPDPHIHLITSGYGRRRPDGQWLLCPDAMDELVAKACQYAGLPSRPRPACSNLSGVRHSVSKYMSKYMTKQMPVDVEALPEEWANLIPRQWWSQSETCKALVDGHVIKLSPAFASFVVRQQSRLEGMNLGRGGLRTVGWKKTKLAELPIEVYRFRFKDPESLVQAMELFALWVVNGESLSVEDPVMSG